jgi:hypothetical protein
MPTTPLNVIGAGIGNLKKLKITPTATPTISDNIVAVIG